MPLVSLAGNPIVDTGGFEAGFSAGTLVGQQGWQQAGGGGSTATVQSSEVESGSQAVRVDRASLSDDRWAVPVTGMGFPNNRFILVDWDMNVTATNAQSVFGPFFGVETYRATTGLSVLGSLGVDATTGDVLYQQANTGFLTETGQRVNFEEWNSYRILLDFDQNEFSIYLNDNFLLSNAFVDGPASTFVDADIAAIAAAGDALSQNQAGTAYFDNFRVIDISPADFDIDTDVDSNDLATWQTSYGLNSGGDANGDGDTDGADLLVWQRDFDGAVGPLASQMVAVPEPTTLLLGVLALGLSSLRRRIG